MRAVKINLSLSKKLHLLMATVTVAVILLSYVGYNYVKLIKEQSDQLYFGTLLPIYELDTIEFLYVHDVANKLLLNQTSNQSILLLLPSISHTISQIEQNWHQYISHFKSQKEQRYIDYANQTISQAIKQIRALQTRCKGGCFMNELNVSVIQNATLSVHETMSTLRQYELDKAKIRRENLLQAYHHAVFQMLLVMALFILIGLILAILLFSSIQKEQYLLAAATKRLQKANSKLEQASYTDALTALYNRRYFNKIFQTEFRRAYRAKTPIALILMDVDYFKQYNDTYGHQAGDTVLQQIGEALRASLHRPGDYLFRYGGEELAAIICDADENTTDNVCKILHNAVRNLEIPHESSDADDIITISMGAVSYTPLKAMTEDDILKMADINLYEAKNQGRNQYILTYDFKSTISDENINA